MPWPKGKLRCASVNLFGYSGSNGHCIIDHVNNVILNYARPDVRLSTSRGGFANGDLNGYSNGHLENGDRLTNGHGKSGLNDGTISTSLATNLLHHSPVVTAPQKIASAEASTRQLMLLPFSAHNVSSLKLNVNALSQAIDQWSLADIAYTLSCKHSRLQQ